MLDFIGVLGTPKGNPHGVGYLSYSQANMSYSQGSIT